MRIERNIPIMDYIVRKKKFRKCKKYQTIIRVYVVIDRDTCKCKKARKRINDYFL
jgi:hypothetical protein